MADEFFQSTDEDASFIIREASPPADSDAEPADNNEKLETNYVSSSYGPFPPLRFISDGGGPVAHVVASEEGTYVTTVKALYGTSTDWFSMTTYVYLGGGADSHLFTFRGARELHFKTRPDFTVPGDANGDNVYEVIVQTHKAGTSYFVDQLLYVYAPVPAPPPPTGVTIIGTVLDDVITPDFSSVGDALPGGEADTLDGGNGNDTLSAGPGEDLIIGGTGKDIMTGGEGADVFRFALGDSKAGGGVRDVITDFERGVDLLDLSALNITNFDEQVSYKKVGSGLIIYVDVNGNGFDWGDFGLQLTGISALDQASDFIL